MSTPATTEPTPRVECPTCGGTPSQLISGPTWGYWGGSDAEYDECPACEGAGTVPEDEADDLRRHYGSAR